MLPCLAVLVHATRRLNCRSTWQPTLRAGTQTQATKHADLVQTFKTPNALNRHAVAHARTKAQHRTCQSPLPHCHADAMGCAASTTAGGAQGTPPGASVGAADVGKGAAADTTASGTTRVTQSADQGPPEQRLKVRTGCLSCAVCTHTWTPGNSVVRVSLAWTHQFDTRALPSPAWSVASHSSLLALKHPAVYIQLWQIGWPSMCRTLQGGGQRAQLLCACAAGTGGAATLSLSPCCGAVSPSRRGMCEPACRAPRPSWSMWDPCCPSEVSHRQHAACACGRACAICWLHDMMRALPMHHARRA